MPRWNYWGLLGIGHIIAGLIHLRGFAWQLSKDKYPRLVSRGLTVDVDREWVDDGCMTQDPPQPLLESRPIPKTSYTLSSVCHRVFGPFHPVALGQP